MLDHNFYPAAERDLHTGGADCVCGPRVVAYAFSKDDDPPAVLHRRLTAGGGTGT